MGLPGSSFALTRNNTAIGKPMGQKLLTLFYAGVIWPAPYLYQSNSMAFSSRRCAASSGDIWFKIT